MVMERATDIATAKWADMDAITSRHPFKSKHGFWIGRDPENYNRTIGYGQDAGDDRHIFLQGGTRGAKGRTIVINNLVNWQGSIVSVDPKGENASICAARRGDGDEYCDGMGQDVYVLDPYGQADVDDKYRASCNFLSLIDPNSGSLLTDCIELAEALRVAKSGGDGEDWSKDSADLTALIMAYVVTSEKLSDDMRDLLTVRQYLTSGNIEGAEEYFIDKGKTISAHALMFEDIAESTAQGGELANQARAMLENMKSEKYWVSLLSGAVRETLFLTDLQMKEINTVFEGERVLDLKQLREHPKGISVFICLPLREDHPALRWQKALLSIMLRSLRLVQGLPANGHRILFCIDEFANMGKLPFITNQFNAIAGSGVKLFIVTPSLRALETIYGKGWDAILAGCALQIFFQIDEPFAIEFIEKHFGQTQVSMIAQSESIAKGKTEGSSIAEGKTETDATAKGETISNTTGRSTAVSDSVAKMRGESLNITGTQGGGVSSTINASRSNTLGRSEGVSDGRSDTTSQTKNYGWAYNENVSDSVTKSRNDGTNQSKTYRFGMFGLTSTNDGRSEGTGKSKAKSKGSGTTKSGGKSDGKSVTYNRSTNSSTNQSATEQSGTSEGKNLNWSEAVAHGSNNSETQTHGFTETENHSQTIAKSLQKTHSTALSLTHTKTESHTVTVTKGTQESFHKRPLITRDEMNTHLCIVKDREDYNYPGYALVRMSGEDPFVVRKCNYDQDPFFEQKFTPPKEFRAGYKPFCQQRLLPCQYDTRHWLPVGLPPLAIEEDINLHIELLKWSDEWFDKGEQLLNIEFEQIERPEEFEGEIKHIDPVKFSVPYEGKVMDVASPRAMQEDGALMLLRLETPLSDAAKRTIGEKIADKFVKFFNEKLFIERLLRNRKKYIEDEDERRRFEEIERAREEVEAKHKAEAEAKVKPYLSFLLNRWMPFAPLLYSALCILSSGGALLINASMAKNGPPEDIFATIIFTIAGPWITFGVLCSISGFSIIGITLGLVGILLLLCKHHSVDPDKIDYIDIEEHFDIDSALNDSGEYFSKIGSALGLTFTQGILGYWGIGIAVIIACYVLNA